MNTLTLTIFIIALVSCNKPNQNYLYQAKEFTINKDPLGVVVACNAGLQQNKFSDSLYFYRAMALGVIKKYDQALLDWKSFLKNNPSCDTCFLALAKTYLNLQDTTTAEETLKTSPFKLAHFKAQALIERSMIAFYQKKWDQSLDLLNQSTQVKPDYFLPYYFKGFYFSQFAGADEQLPVDLKTYPCLNFDSAFYYFDKALKLNPNFADSYYRKGLVFENTFRNDSALHYYNKALSIDSLKPYSMQRLGVLKKLNKQ